MDEFFKLTTLDRAPTMAESNEYLAEDRVMCLQIYIKQDAGYYLTYIPDAKAFTDAPPSLLVLMKQRRRWQNGSFFAAWRVVANFSEMTRVSDTEHSYWQQLGMLVFMLFFILQ